MARHHRQSRSYGGPARRRQPHVSIWVTGRRADGGLLAVVLPERRLIRRHRAVIASGASWDFRRYIPHVSFAVDDRRDISLVPPYTGLLAFGPEAIE